ncbi:MAG: PAS domain S-box protein [Gemmatimonadota bacterium]|nr:PAS domain S-box protein [Gemmatimonadota bacterium]
MTDAGGRNEGRHASADAATAVALMELADLAWFQVDAERRIVAMSPLMEEVTGFRADDVLGDSCLRIHRCGDCLKGCGVFDRGVVKDIRLELYRADGSLIPVSKSGQVFRDAGGRITGAVEIVRPLDTPPAKAGEARRIEEALAHARYSRSDAAAALGMSRTTLWRKMKQYGLA